MDTEQEAPQGVPQLVDSSGEQIVPDAEPAVFQSSKVIAVELTEDLTIPKGNFLVVPLNAPGNFQSLSRKQFKGLFNALGDTAEGTSEAGPAKNLDDVQSYLRGRNGAVKAATIAKAVGLTVKATERRLRRLQKNGVVSVEAGFWKLTGAPPPQVRRVVVNSTRSRNGVSPQLGRILAAMAHASRVLGTADLTTQQVQPFLAERDKHQYSARLPSALEKGLVEHGSLLPHKRGHHYQITPKGIAIIQQLGTWAFEHDKIAIPEWLESL